MISIIIPSFKRPEVLSYNLSSIASQNIRHAFEVIVLNDGVEDNTENICNHYKEKLNIKYYFTGQRNKDGDKWRVPGFALNIGVKKAKGDIIILCCGEMLHKGETVNLLAEQVMFDKKHLAIPYGKDDKNGDYRKGLSENKPEEYLSDLYNSLPFLATQSPFLLAMSKDIYIEIGGYSELFLGNGYDDNNFQERLLQYGCEYKQVNVHCVHLFEKRYFTWGQDPDHKENEGYLYNKKVYDEIKGELIVNKDIEWGKL